MSKTDSISRQEAIEKLKRNKSLFCKNRVEFQMLSKTDKSRVDEIDACIAVLLNLPSAQPERPKGEWIERSTNGEMFSSCSVCGYIEWDAPRNFCPNCGSDNRGEQE